MDTAATIPRRRSHKAILKNTVRLFDRQVVRYGLTLVGRSTARREPSQHMRKTRRMISVDAKKKGKTITHQKEYEPGLIMGARVDRQWQSALCQGSPDYSVYTYLAIKHRRQIDSYEFTDDCGQC